MDEQIVMAVVAFGIVPPHICAGIEHFIIKGHEMSLDPPPFTAMEKLFAAFVVRV